MAITELFKEGKPSIGLFTDWTELPVLEMSMMSGIQYVALDSEHREISPEAQERVLAACQSRGIPVILRLPEFAVRSMGRVLDMGYDGVIIPHIETVAELDEIMDDVYFPPCGKRGIGQARGNKYYFETDTAGYIDYVNSNDWIIAQIESPRGAENAEEIVSHAGVAAVMIGPRDLSTEMGKPGDFFADDVQAKIEYVRDVCKKYHKKLIMPCGVGAFAKYQAKGIDDMLVSAGPLYSAAVKNAVKLALK